MVDNSIPWPKKGDKLFKSDEDWRNNANLTFPKNSILYAHGYKTAGDVLVEYIKKNRPDRDSLVYPIVFSYRHYCELMLKEVIRDGNELLGGPYDFPKNHKIDELWKQCRKILETVWPKNSVEVLDVVEECIYEFSKIDPMSTAFRYPEDKDGKKLLPDLKWISLTNLSQVMSAMETFFTGAIDGISFYSDAKEEMEAHRNNS